MATHNFELRNAVQYLYGKGIIKKDKDISDKTGYKAKAAMKAACGVYSSADWTGPEPPAIVKGLAVRVKQLNKQATF